MQAEVVTTALNESILEKDAFKLSEIVYAVAKGLVTPGAPPCQTAYSKLHTALDLRLISSGAPA